jgi:hypothetical protein
MNRAAGFRDSLGRTVQPNSDACSAVAAAPNANPFDISALKFAFIERAATW